MNQYPITEKENINSRSSLGIVKFSLDEWKICFQSFVSYLTDYRMDRAEEMVLNTDEKSYKIAEKVGYQDANYFSYVFKKKFGVSPSKYRASGKQQSEKQKE